MNARLDRTLHPLAELQRPQGAPEPLLPDAGQAAASPDAPHAHLHRQRDFGIGYGNSSGYGSTLHFIDGHVDAPFRFR